MNILAIADCHGSYTNIKEHPDVWTIPRRRRQYVCKRYPNRGPIYCAQ